MTHPLMLSVRSSKGQSLLDVILFDILEVLISSHLQFSSSSFVTNDDTVWVHLQARDCPFLANWTFNSCMKSASLVVTVAEDQYFLTLIIPNWKVKRGRLTKIVPRS